MSRPQSWRWRRPVAVLFGTAVVVAAVTGLAGGTTLTIETFTNPTVTTPSDWVAGGSGTPDSEWPGQACLTAGTNTSQPGIIGCNSSSPPPDAAGSGALRLTGPDTYQAGFALFQTAQPVSAGLDVSFEQAQYGGTGADGIAFFLVDGSTTLTQPGAQGGSLGYATDGTTPGVTNGLLGIGLDVYGNYDNLGGGSGCTAPVGSPGSPGKTAGLVPDDVGIRGPGNDLAGYCWLGDSGPLPTGLSLGPNPSGTRASSTRLVRIVIDPSSAPSPMVTVYLDGTQVLQIPEPPQLLSATTFKFGFTGGTGASTDLHEVWDLTINTVVPLTVAAPPPPTVITPTFTG